MLGEIFQRFVEKSPIAVMVRGVLERVLGAEALDAWYERTAQKQYTQTLLFSTLYELMSAVVFAIKPSVHAAYQGREAEVGTSIVSVYSKLKGIELQTSAELVRYSATALAPIVEQVGGAREPWLAGYQVKIIDGNCLEATEHRLKPLRELGAGALPGKSLVVFDPVLGLVTEVFPCEDGHAQERALLGGYCRRSRRVSCGCMTVISVPVIFSVGTWYAGRFSSAASISSCPGKRSVSCARPVGLRPARWPSNGSGCAIQRVTGIRFGGSGWSWMNRPVMVSR